MKKNLKIGQYCDDLEKCLRLKRRSIANEIGRCRTLSYVAQRHCRRNWTRFKFLAICRTASHGTRTATYLHSPNWSVGPPFMLLATCIGSPEPVTAVVGDSVILPCHTTLSTPVDWRYLANASAPSQYVSASGYIQKNFKGRFSLYSAVKGEHSLSISDVQLPDSGLYICIEDAGIGERHTFKLTGTGSRCLLVTCTKFKLLLFLKAG